MSGELVSVELDLRAFNREMNAFRAGLKNWRVAILWFWQRWAVKVYQEWVMIRRPGGSFRGHSWEPLKDSTRPEKGASAIINMRRGDMMRAIMNSGGSGTAMKLGPPTIQDKSILIIGNNLPDYAGYALDKGGRNVLFFKLPEDSDLAVESARLYIEKLKAASFPRG